MPPPLDPFIPLAKERTDLTQVVRKKEFSYSVLKAIYLESINTRYTQSDWFHVYTDGLRGDQDGSGGAGIFSELFTFYLNLGANATPFDGEVKAIRMTIQILLFRKEAFNSFLTPFLQYKL
ncbi:hypothetical protein TNCT_343871 [Trichonephila clavata]|uniref:Uncharacterized protein n=1 Tax=Trichonephila clavata TaxID=2740835 RepID=A0A8X6LT26_TRICU|nr:hypothetical protein TNCT_343871 [Trichonephila clavata]